MLPVLLLVLAADEAVRTPEPAQPAAESRAADEVVRAPAPAAHSDSRARDTAALGVVTAVIAAGLAVLVPISDRPQPGTTPLPLLLGTTGFVLVAMVRPVVFFSNQPNRPKPTTLNNALRIIGSLTAVL